MKYKYTENNRHYYLMSFDEVMEGINNNNKELINILRRGLNLDTVGMNVYHTKKNDGTHIYTFTSYSSHEEIERSESYWYAYQSDECVNNPAILLLLEIQEK